MRIPTLGRPKIARSAEQEDMGFIPLCTPFIGEIRGVEVVLISRDHTPAGRFELVSNGQHVRADAVTSWRNIS